MGSPLNLTLLPVPEPAALTSSPTYTDIFNETMGALATPADGFEAAMANLADMQTAFEADVADGDADLADTVSVGAAFDPSVAEELAAALPGVTATGDTSLTTIDGLALGQVKGSGGGGGGGPVACGATSISQPSDGCIGTVVGAAQPFTPSDTPTVVDNIGYDGTTNQSGLGAYLIPGFGGSDNITAAQLVYVSGGVQRVSLAKVFQGGAIQKEVTYLQFDLDPGTDFFAGMIAVQVNNIAAWAAIQYSFSAIRG